MSDDHAVDILMDHQQNPTEPPSNITIDPSTTQIDSTSDPAQSSTITTEPSKTQDPSTTTKKEKEKGKKKKDKDEKEKDKKKKDKTEAGDGESIPLTSNETENEHHDNDEDEKSGEWSENQPKEKTGKKKKKEKSNIEPTSDVIDYVSHSGHHYELIKVQPKGKYDVKMHMTNERTFFKYLFASFHLGAMGTFLLQYYSQPSFYKPVLIGFIWLTAFSFICVGLYTYYQRRDFLKQGKMKNLDGLQIHGPTYILCFFFLVFVTILIYSLDKIPTKTKLQLDNGTGDGLQGNDLGHHKQVNHSQYARTQSNTPTPFTTLLPVG